MTPNGANRCQVIAEAAAELGAIARECHRLALQTGDQTLIAEAKANLAMVAGFAKRDYS
jgi:hypothetical protein